MRRLMLAAAVVLSGCATTGKVTQDYTPPEPAQETGPFTATIGKEFDQAWTDLIENASSMFFSIEHVEKESGLLTLTFSASDPERFADCGSIDFTSPYGDYSGPYIGFLKRYFQNTVLEAKANIFLKPVSEETTLARVNIQYTLASRGGSLASTSVWTFETGGQDTITSYNHMEKTSSSTTCRPTHRAEALLLEAASR